MGGGNGHGNPNGQASTTFFGNADACAAGNGHHNGKVKGIKIDIVSG